MYYKNMTNTMQQSTEESTLQTNTDSTVNDDNNGNNGSTRITVSEKSEGKPYSEWTVGIIVAVCAVLAFAGYVAAAIVVISVTAVIIGVMRLVLRQRSPWKVRTVGFDSFISIALGVGLLITYASIALLL